MVNSTGTQHDNTKDLWDHLVHNYKKELHTQGFDAFAEMVKLMLPSNSHPGKALERFNAICQKMVSLKVDFKLIVLYFLISKMLDMYQTLRVKHLNKISLTGVTTTHIDNLIVAISTHWDQKSLVSKLIGKKPENANKMGGLQKHQGELSHQHQSQWPDTDGNGPDGTKWCVGSRGSSNHRYGG